MNGAPSSKLNPRRVRLETSTVCQLKCPSCPTASGETGKGLGAGFLPFENFKRFVDANPNVSRIEISNWGEIFLNKDIVRILEYAHKRNVALTAGNGSNLNTVSPDALRAVVRYKLRFITCSIDGATQETYSLYRVKGCFDAVLNNIREINKWKRHYRSFYPILRWQYVAFAHNEHEIIKAKALARELGMQFMLKLSWGPLYNKEFSPVKNRALIRKESGLDVADRDEYRERYGQEYMGRDVCLEMWHEPQVNIDGRLLGCSVNYWGDYGNVFEDGFLNAVNSERINYARDMLMGKSAAQPGIPCSTCRIYANMKRHRQWIPAEETRLWQTSSRKYIFTEKVFGQRLAGWANTAMYESRCFVGFLSSIVRPGGLARLRCRGRDPARLLSSQGHAIPPAIGPDTNQRWVTRHFFDGWTASLDYIQCHVSSLIRGHSPHPPHRHREEEIMVMLSGEADLILPDMTPALERQRLRVRAGDFVYYPAYNNHTVQAISPEPANYLMFKWYATKKNKAARLGFEHHDAFKIGEALAGGQEFSYKIVFEGATRYLKKLQCHVSLLKPGGGYGAHADPYDVAVILLAGEVETLGRTFGAGSVIYYAAGQPHGMRNPGACPAQYVVFEFHGERR